MTAHQQMFERMAIADLRAWASTEGDHQDEAARVFVERALNMEVQRREDPEFQHLGASPVCNLGTDGLGGTDIAREPLASAYDRGINTHESHQQVRRFLEGARLPERKLVAALINARKQDPRMEGDAWCKSFDFIADNLGMYAQMLSWPPGVAALGWFRDGQAIRKAAHSARAELIMQAKL